jgi:hypothetical protein
MKKADKNTEAARHEAYFASPDLPALLEENAAAARQVSYALVEIARQMPHQIEKMQEDIKKFDDEWNRRQEQARQRTERAGLSRLGRDGKLRPQRSSFV